LSYERKLAAARGHQPHLRARVVHGGLQPRGGALGVDARRM